jgi:hypothetical protein
MKSVNRLLFGLLSLNAAAVGAQSTQPLLESGKTWSCYGDYFFYNVKYRLGADTVIGELVYKKMLASTDIQPFVFNPETAMYKSAVRESNGQVFVVEKGFLAEHLLYDFNLNTGDEVQFYRPSGNINQGVLPKTYPPGSPLVPPEMTHPEIGHHQKLNEYLTNYIAEHKILL